MTALRWTYSPSGETVRRFMLSDAFVRGIMGPVGSGKSAGCCVETWRRANEQRPSPDGRRRTRWAIIRNTFPELKTTTVKTWEQWIPRTLGDWREQGPPTHHLVTSDLDMEVLFLALDRPDDISKLLSLELTGAWINEAREVPKAVLDALTGRVGRYPAVRDGGCTWSGVLMDTNPPDTDHWWYRLAEEGTPEGFAFYRQPAGDSPAAENLANLPKGYYERIAAGKSDDWTKVYVKGEYGFARDGKPVFPEYADSAHCRADELHPTAPLHVGMDFGLTPAAVIGQRKPDGTWLLRAELVTDNMGAKNFARELRRLLGERFPGRKIERITGDPAGDQRAQTDEETVFQVLRSEGIDATPASTNDFVLRREAVANCLSRMVGGKVGIVIHPDCRQLRKAMAGAYCYRRLQISGEERYRDVPDKTAASHVADAAQYLLLGAGEGRVVLRRPEPVKTEPRYQSKRKVAASGWAA